MLSTTIKERTKESHQLLEKEVVMRLKAVRSLSDYADILKIFYAYFNALEQKIAPYINTELLPDLAERRNSSDLKNDIEALGSSIDELPTIQELTHVNNALQALGVMYVMEGSIMGGPIIVQMLAKYGVDKGVSFFSGYGEATGMMWGKFVAVMNAQPQSEDDETTAVAAANETFLLFSHLF